MTRHGILLALALACAVSADARWPRVRLGGVTVGAGYSRWSGYPYFYAPYAPFFPGYFAWDPFLYHPYYWSGFAYGPNMGEVKLKAGRRDAEVFIDGAYAGTAAERKSMWLDPGAYNVEVRAPDRAPFVRRIYVLSGKTLRIDAKLEAQP